jgi:hypothetical protein
MNAVRVLAFVIPLSASSLSFAQGAPPAETKAVAVREGPAAPAKGLVVFIDPVTGKIRQPDPAEIGGLVAPPAAVTRPVEAPLVMKFGPGGAVGVVLDSRFESFMVVTKKPDGKLAMDCVTGEQKAHEAISAGANHVHKPDGKEVPRAK